MAGFSRFELFHLTTTATATLTTNLFSYLFIIYFFPKLKPRKRWVGYGWNLLPCTWVIFFQMYRSIIIAILITVPSRQHLKSISFIPTLELEEKALRHFLFIYKLEHIKKNPEIETWKLLRRIDRTLPQQKHGDLFLIVPSFINNDVTKSVKSLKCYYSLSSILDIEIRCGNNPAWWSLSLKSLLYLTILHYNQ